MRALSSLDSMFLATEDGRTVANICSLAIIDSCDSRGKPLTRRDVQELIGERLPLLPPLRWRLADVPLGLGHPWWVDCGGDVDLDFHVRETAVVSPGDQDALETLASRISAHPMDRSRPLWEVYLIHGLSDDRAALLIKLHHAAVDGLSGGNVLEVLFDTTAEGRNATPITGYRGRRHPGQFEMIARTLTEMPRRQAKSVAAAGRTLTHLDQVVTLRSVPGIGDVGRLLRRMSSPRSRRAPTASMPTAPRMRFNGKISPHRRVALTSLSLDDVKDVKAYYESTVNDIVVALCAGALRRWLIDHDGLPDVPLVAAIPVSTRAPAEIGTYGNQVGTMLAVLPTDTADAATRVMRCRNGLRAAKECHQATPASLMRDANDLIPPPLFSQAVRAMTSLAAGDAVAPVANLVISNVPGSRVPLFFAGRPLREHYPVSTISDSLGLNVTVFSYLDRLEIGLVGDRYTVPDLAGLADAFDKELTMLKASLQQPVGGRK